MMATLGQKRRAELMASLDRSETEPFRKRQFLLSLSIQDGQNIAKAMGFQPASKDVQDSEREDTLRRLVEMGATGIAASLVEATEWMCELLAIRLDLDEEERQNSHNVFLAHSVASCLKLIDEGLVSPTFPVRAVILKEDSTDE